MTGMGGGGVETGNPVVVEAFHTLLLHQCLIVLAILLAGSLLWLLLSGSAAQPRQTSSEPRARAILRYGFGGLWILDALLQAQPSMPLGLSDGVLKAGAATSPSWVQHLASSGAGIWTRQPVVSAVAVLWIQLGIGIWILLAKNGAPSRLAAFAGIVWALVIWVSSGLGGIFAPGASLLLGAPGASLLYVLGGVLLLVPTAQWASPRFQLMSRRLLGGALVAAGILQAFPGRGTWSGLNAHGKIVGQLASMASAMADVHQPSLVGTAVRHFSSFAAHWPLLVNGLAVCILVGVGGVFLLRSPKYLKIAMWSGLLFFLVIWVFVQDLGVFGGLATDPNSMVPLVILLFAIGTATLQPPEHDETMAVVTKVPSDVPDETSPQRAQHPMLLWTSTVASVLIIALGLIPLGVAAASGSTDPVLALALNDPPQKANFASYPLHLVDQHGVPVSMATFRGRAIAMTFLDPVCVTDCPEIGSEMAVTSSLLGSDASKVALVAVVANPTYTSLAAVRAFDRHLGLTSLKNWYYLTGPLPELERVWAYYNAGTVNVDGGAMTLHNDLTYVFDARGRVRIIMNSTPGGTGVLHDSYSALLTRELRTVLP